MIGTLIFVAIVGTLVGFLSFKFARAYAVSVIAAWGGIAIFVTVIKLVGLRGTAYSITGAIIGAVLGFVLGKKYNTLVRSIGTAIIGAYFTTRGLGTFIGGYPNETDFVNNVGNGKLTYNTAIIGYVACMITLAVVGSIVQVRLYGAENAKSADEFNEEDESKRCGCF